MTPRPFSAESLSSLARANLSLFVSCTALSVYLYYRHAVDPGAFYLFSGVFLLACAASAINQLQERTIDSVMERTKNRPLPAIRMKPVHVAAFAGTAGCAGMSVLYFGTRPAAALVGGITLFIYNVVYTPLKTRTSFGLLFGAIAGALPVLIGALAAAGRIDAKAIGIAIFVFLWQVPHFLLLLFRYEDDYRRAGFATLLSRMSPERLRNIITIWLLAACGATTLFPIFGIVRTVPLVAVIAGLNICMIIKIYTSFPRKAGFFPLGALYVYQGIIFIVLIIQGLLGRVFPEMMR